jgi:CPA1 family monovalent cation:H+ antiporter
MLAPFVAYLVADELGASGVLAVVTAGFSLSRSAPRIVSARTRVRARNVWETVTFLIGALVFTLIGVQLGRLAPMLWRNGEPWLLRAALLVSAAVIGVRLIWVFTAVYVLRLRSSDPPPPPWRGAVVLAWAGLRGGDTLVMVLAVPLTTAAGAPFPGRDTVVAVGLGVIFVTLVLQGLTLRPLIRWLALPRDDVVETEERKARLEAERAATRRLEEIVRHKPLPRDVVDYLRAQLRLRTKLDLDDIEHLGGHDGQTTEDVVRETEQALRDAARQAVVRMRDDNVIGQEALRRIQYDLDLDEIRSVDESLSRTAKT